MAKKRIAADVDLCGNSVENVKNVTASGTVKAGTLEGALNASSAGKTNGKVATLPNYTFKNLFGEGKYVGATGGPTYPEFYKKWLQQLVADNLLTDRTTYFCQAEPNDVVAIMLSVTDVTPLSSDGLPRICCATAINYTGDRTMFGVNIGTYYCYTSAYSGNGTATRAALDGNGANIANTYATKSEVNNKVTKNNPEGVQAYEGNLKFGTGSVAGSVNPLDMALIPECGANRFAFLPPECITIEYSRDAGATWLDYGASDVVKTNLTSIKGGAALIIGKSTNANPADANCRLRVIFKTQSSIAKLYDLFKKFAIFVSTNGSYGNVLSWCTIQARTMANVESGSDTWVTFANKVKVSGNSGWNIINTSDILTYANIKTQYGELRFIFGADGVSDSGSAGFVVRSIFAYGSNAWQTPSEMSKTGRLYSYDYAQNATFPNGVTAKSFTGNLEGTAKKATQDAKGNTIDTTYAKTSDFAKLQQTVNGHSTAISNQNGQITSVTDRTKALEDKTVDMRVDESGETLFGGRVINDEDGNVIKNTYAHGVSIYDDTGDFVETADAIENGYLKLQDSEDIQVNQHQDSTGKNTIGFSLTAEAKEKMGARRVIAYGVPDSSGKIASENKDVIAQDDNHDLNVISSDSVYVGASSVTLDVDPQQSVDGIKMSVRLDPNGGLESTPNGLKVSQLSDGFYTAPKLILSTNDDADGGTALYIDHPCRGTSGVEFVLMNKSRRTRGGIGTGGYNHKTRDRKRGWTVAMNYRRAAMSYDIARDDLEPCVLGNELTDIDNIAGYVKKFYMYPFNVSSIYIDTTNIALTSLYFGGWGMTMRRKYTKVFGIAARRLKNGKYEYSQTAVLNVHKVDGKLTFGVK